MARLTILTQDEINALYAIPTLDDEERSFLFSLDVEDRAIIDTLENDTARKVDYILQLGFYRAIGYFFLFSFQKVKPGSRYFCESFYGHPCPTSGKNYATAHVLMQCKNVLYAAK